MEILLYISSFLLQIIGIAGCVLPMLPGPPLAYAGILLLHFTDNIEIPTGLLIGWLLIIVILQVIDYITPILGSKFSGGSKAGEKGCLVGTILGLFMMPWGIIIGPFIGTAIGELISGNTIRHALLSAIGALTGFILGSLLKIVFCCYLLIYSICAFF